MKVKIYIISLMLFLAGNNLSFGQDTYEPNDTPETATQVTCGQELSAYIQVEGDVDWYEIEMEESGVLEAAVTSVPDDLRLNLEIYQFIDNVLTLIADDRGSAGVGDDRFANAVINPGNYLVKVSIDWGTTHNDSDSYQLAFTCTPNALELNQTYEEAAPIALDTCFEDNIYGDNHLYTVTHDVDWFKVEVPTTGVLETAVTSVPDDLRLNLEIYQVIDNVLTLISDDRGSAGTGSDRFSNAVVDPGTYLIVVDIDWGVDYNEDTYSFCSGFTPNALELNQTYEEAAPIALDTCFEDNIYGDNHLYTAAHDVDWFKVEVPTTGVLETAVTSVPDDLRLNLEIYQVIDNVLTLISDDRGSAGTGSDRFSNAVVDPGTYLIVVDIDWGVDYNEDTYSFCSGFTPNALELNQTYEEAAPIALDTCFEDNIYGDNHLYTAAHDVDWFKVEVPTTGVLETAVTSVPDDLRLNLEIYQVIDNVLTLISDDRGSAGTGSDRFSNAVVDPGTYLIVVDIDWGVDYNEDTYSFCSGFTPNALELNQTYEEAAPIALDTCFEDNIYGDNHLYTAAHDVDWFAIEIPEDNYDLQIAVTSVPDNLRLNLEVYQLIDNVLTLIADDGGSAGPGDNRFVSAIVDKGTYLIQVGIDWGVDYNKDTYNFCLGSTDIDEQSLSHQLSVFPNPNNGQCSIRLLTENNDLKILGVNVFDHLGRENTRLREDTFGSNDVLLNMQNSARGIYLIKIRTNLGVVTKKIVVQ